MSEDISILVEETKNRAKFFQTVHCWPLSDKLDYIGWLSNFKSDEDLKIACLLLDFFIYYSDKMIEELLKNSISCAGHLLSKQFKDWNHSDFITRCYYSFIPGESQNPSDSGRIFLRKVRDIVEVSEERLIEYNDIPNFLNNEKKPTPVILVDDFIGSGAQCVKAWNKNIFQFNKKTLNDIAETETHIFIYAPLIVNHTGYERINLNCKNLFLSPAHILGNEYNLFNKDCICWKNDGNLFNQGIELILRKSKEIGIPFSSGKETTDVKGFGEQGLAISFEHGTPDATIPLFYWCNQSWIPLIKKTYER